MLLELYIENVAVIENMTLCFEAGLNVLTGETGAGKSIIIKALAVLSGEKFSKDMIRSQKDFARVSALFGKIGRPALLCLQELKIKLDDEGQLLIERRVEKFEKSTCYVNGVPVLLSALRSLMMHLLDIHGQFENQKLQNAQKQLELIDEAGELKPCVEKYKKMFAAWKEQKDELEKVMMQNQNRAQRLSFLKFQIQDIEAAKLVSCEDELLAKKKVAMQNSAKIKAALLKICEELFANLPSNILDGLRKVIANIKICSEFDQELASFIEPVENIFFELEELGKLADAKLEENQRQVVDVNEVEARLDVIYNLKRKYGSSVDEILEFCQKAEKEAKELSTLDEKEARLQKEVAEQEIKLEIEAKELSKLRRKQAVLFATCVQEQLEFLGMPDVLFVCRYKEIGLGRLGVDEFCFEISTNKGEPARPLAKVASGGELSRIMLAIKSVMTGVGLESCMVFDEIDTGISGEAAKKVAQRLQVISQHSQIICVTHLAQIAALADWHFLIEKGSREEKTFTEVRALKLEERTKELARIISGNSASLIAQENAKELMLSGRRVNGG